MLLDARQDGGLLRISYYDTEGRTKIKNYELTEEDMFNWEVCTDRDKGASSLYKNWDNRPVKKVRSKYLNKYRIIELVNDLSLADKNEIFEYTTPKTYFVDIEVEVTDSFPEPSIAANPVTAICIVTPDKNCIVLATKDLDKNTQSKIQNQIDNHFKKINESFSFSFKCFKSEYDMLYTFLDSFVKRFPLMTGWNFVNFDWKYIITRCKKLGIDVTISSPTKEMFGMHEFPCHVGIMDYLELYSKWDRSVDIKEDFKLDTVGEVVVGIKKVKYEGTIQDLFEKDYPKYIFYNAIDTALVYLIHNKLKTLDIALTIAHMSNISIFKASSPVAITEALLCKELLKEHKVMAKDPMQRNRKTEQYEGAFVKDPIIGMHKAVACFDFASLYPSIMREMNVSPESFIKKINPSDVNKEKGDDRIVSVNGAVYLTEESILKKILSRLYSQRKEYKKKSFEFQQQAYELEKKVGKN
jgi:DNA polymerase elongation subunit (family B)